MINLFNKKNKNTYNFNINDNLLNVENKGKIK